MTRLGIRRRSFLKTAAAAGVLAACGDLDGAWPRPYAIPKGPVPGAEDFRPGEERLLRSVCLGCAAGCGIRVRVVEGRAVKIEGNPDHPLNVGRLCDRGQTGLLSLYAPDRVRGPLRRDGPRGSGRFVRASWDEAISALHDALARVRAQGAPERVALLAGRRPGLMKPFLDRFLEAYGSPNLIDCGCVDDEATAIALDLQQGVRALPAYDFENTRYVLSFGAALADAFRPAVPALRAFADLKRPRPGKRAKLVQIEPRLSVTGVKADEWVPHRPGTEAALALAIAHVLVRDELYDRAFVDERTLGLDDWTDAAGRSHAGFRKLLLEEYSPEQVAPLTGVAAATVTRIASEMAANGPAVAVPRRQPGSVGNGVYSAMAIHALNALLGSIGRPGGVLVQDAPPVADWPELVLDDTARRGLAAPRLDGAGTMAFPLGESVASALPEAILGDRPHPVDVLLYYNHDRERGSVDSDRFREALEKVPAVFSFSPFLDETASYADWVLPDHTYLEQTGDMFAPPSVGYAVVGLRQPVVAPLYDTRDTGDVLLEVAQRLEGAVAEAFPFESYAKMLDHAHKGLHAAKRGTIVEKRFGRFRKRLRETGVWADPPYRFGRDEPVVFKTPSGRFEFFSQALRVRLLELAPSGGTDGAGVEEERLATVLRDLGVTARGDGAFLPHHEAHTTPSSEVDFPFDVHVFRMHPTTTRPAQGELERPRISDFLGRRRAEERKGWCELNPQFAEGAGIEEGDTVWVESPAGRVRLRARLHAGTMPRVVNLPRGLGRGVLGGLLNDAPAGLDVLTANTADRLGGFPAWRPTRVRVYTA